MDISIFSDLFSQGLHPIPLHWNIEKKQAEIYPEHKTDIHSLDGKPDMNDITRWFQKIQNCNAVALKLYPPFFMLDFDLKNDERKNIYDDWYNIVTSTNDDVLRKMCIERTRSGGYHVYGKFKGVDNKKMLAISRDKKEVISVYTGGLLSFCAPTPDYELIHNDFADISELNQDEFDVICGAASHFNAHTSSDILTNDTKIITYPTEYESTAMQFDSECTEDIFEKLLNSIDLFEVKNKRLPKGQEHLPYLRKGSNAAYSAKVYFKSKKLLIFSGSYVDFPNFHNKINENDTSWILTPTKIIFYKNLRDWQKTIKDIIYICETHGINLAPQLPVTKQPINDRLNFPYDIFPEKIQQFVFAQSIQHEYLAGAILGALSAAIGNTTYLEAMPGYNVKSILYMAIVAPPGAAKTPAVKKAFSPLEELDNDSYIVYKTAMDDYDKLLSDYEKDKKNGTKPELPNFPQTIIKDSTIEMVSHILMTNPNGCCILADELSGFLNRMNQYKAGDEEQKWLELWSGSSILNQRVSTGVKKVTDPFCSIIGGIQPGVLESLSKEERQHNGFYHRFLFVYPKQQDKQEWRQVSVPLSITSAFRDIFITMIKHRHKDKIIYELHTDANNLYKEWFDYKNLKYNKATTDNVKGIIAKYQDYCLRFALIIQVIEDCEYRSGIITANVMERAIRLTEYFLGNMHKASKILAPETPLDKLNDNWKEIYDKLESNFSSRTFIQLCATMGVKEGTAKSFLIRSEGKIFGKVERNVYEKMF
jgi:hypothetical protein